MNVDVALASNERYAPGLVATIASLLLATEPTTPVRVHILDGGLSTATWNTLQRIADSVSSAVELHRVEFDKAHFAGFKQDFGNDHMAYARLLMESVLDVAKVIYLDCDMLILKDVGEFWQQPFQGNYVVAVEDPNIRRLKNDCPWRNGGPIDEEAPYFNSGFMLIDMEAWRNANVQDQALELIRQDPSKCTWWDQTALNYCLRGKVRYVDESWNAFWSAVDQREHLDANIHFATREKPWLDFLDCETYWLWYQLVQIVGYKRYPICAFGLCKDYVRLRLKRRVLEMCSGAVPGALSLKQRLARLAGKDSSAQRAAQSLQHWRDYNKNKRAIGARRRRRCEELYRLKSRWRQRMTGRNTRAS